MQRLTLSILSKHRLNAPRCLCVHESTCVWCPGATIVTPETTSLEPAATTLAPGDTTTVALASTTSLESGSHIISRPSSIPYCPVHFVDCGTCLCVPPTTCGFCPGAWSPSPPPAPVVGGSERPSVVPGCPASYVDCGTCLCLGFGRKNLEVFWFCLLGELGSDEIEMLHKPMPGVCHRQVASGVQDMQIHIPLQLLVASPDPPASLAVLHPMWTVEPACAWPRQHANSAREELPLPLQFTAATSDHPRFRAALPHTLTVALVCRLA